MERGRFQLCSRDICHDFNYYFILNHLTCIIYLCCVRKQFQIESKEEFVTERIGTHCVFFKSLKFRIESRKSNTHLVCKWPSVFFSCIVLLQNHQFHDSFRWFGLDFLWAWMRPRVILILFIFHESPIRQVWILYIHLICFQ